MIVSYVYINILFRNPVARIMPSRTYLGKPVSAKVAYFSSRGPNSIAQAILKVTALSGINFVHQKKC